MEPGERALRATLDGVLAAMDDAVLAVDEERVAWVNPSAATMLGCPEPELIGSPWQRWLELPSLPMLATRHDVRARRADASVFPVECAFRRVDLGERSLCLCVLRDASARQVLDTSEQVRRQIGQDLHDGLGQLLTGTALLAKGLEADVDAEHRPRVERVVELINQAIGHVRELARGTSPLPSQPRRLEAALRDVVDESSQLLGVECVLEVDGPVETSRPATVLQLCLIAREAIHNAVRHGSAHRIGVRLSREGTRSIISITDDGVGIQVSEEPPVGAGLRSMRHRASLIGGALEIARAPVGTVVRCSWPD